MMRDTSAVDYQDLARELAAATQQVGGDAVLMEESLDRANAALVRATTPSPRRSTNCMRDDTLAALHAARRAADRQRALAGALEVERAQLQRELAGITERANAVARYRAISSTSPREGLDSTG